MAAQDVASPPNFGQTRQQPASVREILAALDASIAAVRQTLPTFDDQRMQAVWKLKQGDKELMSIPRVAFLRSILLNHWYHHRGQLGVYLRLLDAKVPSSYGPSADEQPEFMQTGSRG